MNDCDETGVCSIHGCDMDGKHCPECDPTPYCHVCGAMKREQCDCPDPFYARNH